MPNLENIGITTVFTTAQGIIACTAIKYVMSIITI